MIHSIVIRYFFEKPHFFASYKVRAGAEDSLSFGMLERKRAKNSRNYFLLTMLKKSWLFDNSQDRVTELGALESYGFGPLQSLFFIFSYGLSYRNTHQDLLARLIISQRSKLNAFHDFIFVHEAV